MNPAPCIPIEVVHVVSCGDVYRTRVQIRKGLLRVWNPGESTYFLWISASIYWPWKSRNSGARWWQPPTG